MPSAVASPNKMSGGGSSRSPGVNRFGFHSSPRKFSSPKPSQRPAPESPNLTNIRRNLKPVSSSPSTGSTSSRELVTPAKDVSTARAAYLCVKSNVASDLETDEELATALQFCGFNPTIKTISEIRSKMGPKIAFQDFEELVEAKGSKFPAHASLMKAFRLLDPAGTGRIPKLTLTELLTERGQKLDQSMVAKYIDDPRFQDPNNPDLFNYIEFAENVRSTSDQLVNQVKVLAAEAERDFAVNSKTYKVRRKSASPKKPSVPAPLSTELQQAQWKLTKSSKGAFFFEGESLISHQFNLEISTRQKVEIELESLDSSIDCQLYIFKVNEVVVNRNSESRYLLVERTPITAPFFSPTISWCGYLDVGSYLLMPSTTGCRIKRRKHQPSPEVELVDILGPSKGAKPMVSLSSKFRQVLAEIFNQIDLDGSGGLSRQEFNLFNWRTSGEEVQDDEWRVVRENFDLVNGELTLKGFMQLHQMEAEDSSGDSAELWVTLNAMGYNYNLEQDEAALFRITARTEMENPVSMSLYVSGLRSGGPILDKATIRCVMENGTTDPHVVDKDITVFQEDLGNCTSIVVQNKSSSTVALNMDFSHSQNVLINHPHLIFSTTLSAKSTLFVAHLIPDDPTLKHSVSLNVTLVNGR